MLLLPLPRPLPPPPPVINTFCDNFIARKYVGRFTYSLKDGVVCYCPGFGQDRVNFHRNPGRDTAGRAHPTWPDRAGYSIPCAIMLGSCGGEQGGGNSLAARERAAAVQSGRAALWVLWFVLCFLLICIVVVTVPFVCCSVKLPLS